MDGDIPAELGNLTNLEILRLQINELDGDIPILSRLTKLTLLIMYENHLTGGIPDYVGTLTNLEGINLSNNELSGDIPNLSSLTNLEQLDISRNLLTGTIPEELGNLDTLLTGLYLWGNQLTGEIPDSLGNLINLNHLALHENHLSGDFPPELGNLTNLQIARFATNTDAVGNPSLTGCVPLGLRYLMDADDFVDPGGRIADQPAQDFIGDDANNDGDFDDLGDTPGLNLPFCMLSALAFSDVSLTPAFASATAAYTASVANTVESTTVTATLADSNDSVSIMKGTASYPSGASVPLAVGPNEITITVTASDATPTLTYTMTVFREGVDRATLMALYNSTGGASWTDKTNWLSTTEPIGEWSGVEADSNGNVTRLELPGNNLSGTLPGSLGSLTNLTTLDLSDNSLSGMIPDLSALTQLQNLNLGDNQLSGTIPDLSALTNLQDLYLGGNQLSGTIPDWLGSLIGLQDLSLRGNQFDRDDPGRAGQPQPVGSPVL